MQHRPTKLASMFDRERAPTCGRAACENDRAVRFANVELGPNRVVGREGLAQPVPGWHCTVLSASTGGTPSAVLDSERDRGVEPATIGAGLAAAHDTSHGRALHRVWRAHRLRSARMWQRHERTYRRDKL